MAQIPWEEVVNILSAELDAAPKQFFATFSRFEWAIGQEGPTYTLKPPYVGINWDLVGQAFGGKFYQLVKADPVASRIVVDPPQAITNEEGVGLRFNEDPPPCGDASAVFNALARIRNNFFHGWKRGIEDDDRKHIADGNAVLRLAYEFCDNHPKLQMVGYRMVHA